MADFSSIYDLPAQTSPDKTAFDVMGGNSEDICSPVFTKMDPSCELLSLDSLGDSEFGYEDYLSSDGTYCFVSECVPILACVFIKLCV